MKSLFAFITLLLPLAALADRAPVAYVYAGKGVCDGCAESLAVPLEKAGFKIKYARPGNFSDAELRSVSLIAVPGGEEEIDVKLALHAGEADAIHRYVENGGHYLGVCLGGYLATEWLIDSATRSEKGLDLFKGEVFNHSPTKKAHMEDILWLGKHRSMYFQDGPEFALTADSNATIWAYYDNQDIAAFQTALGKGRVGLIGPHPEADRTWWEEDQVTDSDGKDDDLMIEFVNALVFD
jgi:glutamine amidotransferase-like uncharacterized protein